MASKGPGGVLGALPPSWGCRGRTAMTALGCAGASEPRQLGYMVRLGLWGPGQPAFADFPAFLDALGHRGVGALELVGCSCCFSASSHARLPAVTAKNFAMHGL